MTRLRGIPLLLLALAMAAPAAQKKPDPKKDDKKQDAKKPDQKKKKPPPKAPTKPDNATWLDKRKGSWYFLHTPEKYTRKEKYPLIVLTRAGGRDAKNDLKNWAPLAKTDRVFLAALDLHKDYKGDKLKPQIDMLAKILKEYPAIERRSLVLLGVSGGANEALNITASYPRLFAATIVLSPDKYPDITKVKPAGPAISKAYTPIFLTVDDKNKKAVEAYAKAKKDFARKHLRFIPQRAEGVGGGKASEDELKFTRKVLLEKCYSKAKRAQVVAALREADRKEREKKAAEAAKLAAADKPKPEPKTNGGATAKPPPKGAPEPMDPDDLLEKARGYDEEGKYADAFRAYARLAKENPDSDYAREAERRIKKLRDDPNLAKAIADAEAGGEARSMLTRARNFAMGKITDKAIPEYEKIILRFPGTTYADSAQRELDKLQAKE